MSSSKRADGPGTDPTWMAPTIPSDPGSSAPPEGIGTAETLLDFGPEAGSIATGEVLGERYRILGELGRGGEGVVYRALDLRADAVVALKLLQRDEARIARFRRELQMARKVTHPNVVRIHDLVELRGRFGLSMELVEGETLDRRLDRTGPLPVAELLALADDLANALAAAHAAGITHRDLKPANILLRAEDGRALVSDFGIARLHGATDAAPVVASQSMPIRITSEGAIVGTPQYMAPEQLQGRTDIGPAADVFAFGLVLREAATGERLHDEASRIGELRTKRSSVPAEPIRLARADFSEAFAAIVDRCLAIEPSARYADGKALVEALAAARAPKLEPRKSSAVWGLAAAVVVVGGASLALWSHRNARPRPSPAMPPPTASAHAPAIAPITLRVTSPRRITFGDGCEEFPSFSSDGDTIVYDATLGANSYLYAMSLSGGSPRKLTDVIGWDFAASISPDGRRVAFLRFDETHKGTYVLDLDGHSEPRLLAAGNVRPAWAPDGHSIWAGDPDKIARYDAESGAVLESFAPPPGDPILMLRDVGGGRLVAIVPRTTKSTGGGLLSFGADRSAHLLLDADVDEALAILPGGRHLLASRLRNSAEPELLDVPLDGSPPTSLASAGIAPRKGLDLSRDGRKIAWSTCHAKFSIAKLERGGKLTSIAANADWNEDAAEWIPGTSSLAVLSSRGATLQPWIVDLSERTMPRRIAVPGPEPTGLAVSPDAKWMALDLPPQGIAVVPLDGSAEPRFVARGTVSGPSFRKDGDSILFTQIDAGGTPRAMIVSVRGSEPKPLFDRAARHAFASTADDRVVFATGARDDQLVPMIFDPRTGKTTPASSKLEPAPYAGMRFSPDGRRLALVRGGQEVVEIDLRSGAVLQARRFDDQIRWLTYVHDELYVSRAQWVGDVWLADVELGGGR